MTIGKLYPDCTVFFPSDLSKCNLRSFLIRRHVSFCGQQPFIRCNRAWATATTIAFDSRTRPYHAERRFLPPDSYQPNDCNRISKALHKSATHAVKITFHFIPAQNGKETTTSVSQRFWAWSLPVSVRFAEDKVECSTVDPSLVIVYFEWAFPNLHPGVRNLSLGYFFSCIVVNHISLRTFPRSLFLDQSVEVASSH